MIQLNAEVPTRDGGTMGCYIARPTGPSRGSVIAIMEIWGVNDVMRRHAHEFADAGYTCLVPDIFWRMERGIDLNPADERDFFHALDLYYSFDYDLAVHDLEDAAAYLEAQDGKKVGAVGYCLGGKLCYLMCCRTELECAVGYYGTYIEHSIREAPTLHRPFMLHTAGKDDIVPESIRKFIKSKLVDNPVVEIHHYPEAGHAFARFGGAPYRHDDAELALSRTLEFFGQHLG